MSDHSSNIQKITADLLSDTQQKKLSNILKHKAVQKIVNDVMANPPTIDLSEVEIVLGEGKSIDDFDVNDRNWVASGGCETCSAIGGGCDTCSAIS